MQEVIAYYADRNEEELYDFYLDRYTEVSKWLHIQWSHWENHKIDLQFLSDTMFNVATVDSVMARRLDNSNLYLYKFDYYNEAIWPKKFPERLRGLVILSFHLSLDVSAPLLELCLIANVCNVAIGLSSSHDNIITCLFVYYMDTHVKQIISPGIQQK